MAVASRTPEGEPFACRVCGAVDRAEPSPLTGDAVCPRCGGYLASVLARFDELLGGAEPVTLDTGLDSLPNCDPYDWADRVEDLAEQLRVRPNWDELERCRTVEDLVRYLLELRDRAG